MTDHKQGGKRAGSAKGHLLLSETESPLKSIHEGQGVERAKSVAAADAPVSDEAPGSDEAYFVEQAMNSTAALAHFGMMIVCIDDIGHVIKPERVASDVSGIVGKVIEKEGGTWHKTGKDVFGCCLPDKDESACRSVAEKICGQTLKQAKATVSIGIAVYPTLSYEKKDVFENAKKALAHAGFFGPGSIVCFDAVSLNISGDNFYQAGRKEEALAEYDRALAMDPENVNVHNSIGVCYGDREDWDNALAAFNKAMALDPADAFAVYNAGYIHMQKQDYAAALGFFQRAIELDGSIFELLFQTGRALFELGRPEEALSYIDQAMAINDAPGGIVYRIIGDCNMALDRAADAIKAYNTALKLRPDDAHSLSELALCYENENRNPEIALMFGENAVEIQPENGLFHHRLAMMYFNRGRFEEAIAHFEAAVEHGHEPSTPHLESTREMMAGSARKTNIAGS